MRVIAYDDVLAAAREQFLATSGIDVSAIAASLHVSRATLYRVIDSQDRLLGDVLWQLADETYEWAMRSTEDLEGADRIIDVAHRFESAIASFEVLQRWVGEEPLQASRVLFTPAGAVHERIVQRWVEVFTDEVAAGTLSLPMEPDQFAFLFVRVGEMALYGELLAGVTPDPDAMMRLRRAMMDGPSPEQPGAQ